MDQAIAQAKEEHKIELLVTYNGVIERLKPKLDDTIAELLAEAIKKFGPLPQPHTLALYRESGQELTNESQTVRQAGLIEGEKLLLRPSTVKGG